MDQAYLEGAFDTIDYTKPPGPPLEAEDAARANELLKNAREC